MQKWMAKQMEMHQLTKSGTSSQSLDEGKTVKEPKKLSWYDLAFQSWMFIFKLLIHCFLVNNSASIQLLYSLVSKPPPESKPPSKGSRVYNAFLMEKSLKENPRAYNPDYIYSTFNI